MRLRTDDRAVTVQIGTVLLFAVLIVLLSTYQATVVPQQNEQVEFNHNQQVHGQLQDLRDELLRTGATGSSGSASVALGTQYPVRAFFVNPAPPSGTLRTTDPADVTIENAVASGEVGDYWNGDEQNFETRGLVYEPNYHVYQNPPTTVYRNGVLYNRFGGANIALAGQRLVRGNRITLVSLDGELAESSSSVASVNVRAVSPSARTVTVRNQAPDEKVTLSIPTDRDAEEWEELLAGELDEDGTNPDKHVEAVEEVPDENAVRIVLEPGTYQLKLAKVGVGSDVADVSPHYVTVVRGDDESVSAGGKQKIVAEVRDRFNNPVAGATVNVNEVSDGSITPGPPGEVETDANGRATFVYHASSDPDTDDEEILVEIDDGSESRERATATLYVEPSGDVGDGESREYDVNWTDASGESLDDCDTTYTICYVTTSSETDVTLTANVSADSKPAAQATVDYAVNDTSVGGVSPESGVTDADGLSETAVTLEPVNDTVRVYAASGDDVDPIDIQVRRPGGEPEGPADATINALVVDRGANTNADYEVSYYVTDHDGTFDSVEITYDNTQNEWADGDSGPISDPRSTDTFTAGGVGGDTYNVTIRAYDTDGELIAERSIIDPAAADGNDPDDNDPVSDLRRPDSPEIANVTVSDETPQNGGATFDVAYNTTRGNETFPTVEVRFRNLDNDWATETRTNEGEQGAVSYSRGGTNGDEYEIVVTVIDDDGIIVDEAVYSQQADGDDET